MNSSSLPYYYTVKISTVGGPEIFVTKDTPNEVADFLDHFIRVVSSSAITKISVDRVKKTPAIIELELAIEEARRGH